MRLSVILLIIQAVIVSTMSSDSSLSPMTATPQRDNRTIETGTNKHHEPSVGIVQGEFACAWKNYNGTLLAGTQGVAFSGSFFLFETKLVIEWESILKVQNYDETNGSLEILLKDGKSQVFRCLTEKSWLLLMTLHNDALLLDRKTTSATPRLHRSNSDTTSRFTPASASQQTFTEPAEPKISYIPLLVNELPIEFVEKGTGSPVVLHDDNCGYRGMQGRLLSGPQALCYTSRRGAIFWEHVLVTIPWSSIHQIQQVSSGVKVTTIGEKKMEFMFEVKEPNAMWASLIELQNEELTKTPVAHRRRNSDPIAQQLHLDYDDSPTTPRGVHRVVPNSPKRSSRDQPPESPSVVNWETLKSKSLDTTVIEDLRLSPCTVDQFFDTFIATDAPSSLSCFLQEGGDTEVEASPWGDEERVVRYMHPVNAPLAPPQARARKEQQFERYGSKGLIVRTRTVVDDVPMTDCFYVADRILVERVDSATVSVRMEFEIT